MHPLFFVLNKCIGKLEIVINFNQSIVDLLPVYLKVIALAV